MKLVVNALFLTQKITGVQRYAIEISKELKRIFNDKIKFVAPSNIIHHELAEYLDVEVIGNFTGFLWEQVDLKFYLSRNKNPLLLNMRNTAPLFHPKNIIVIHDLIFMKNKKWFSKKFPFIYRFFAPILLKKALKIITVSDFSKQDIIKTFNINPDMIEIVYNAVSKEFQEYSNENFENKYGDYILAVASFLSPRKNLCSAIKAFNKLQVQDLKLVIVGAELKHFSDQNMLDEIKLNKNIILTGYVNDKILANFYKKAKLLVFPSFYEGFGIPAIEAMSCGCPVVASNVTSLPEVCADAACYVNPYMVDDIANGMNKILNNSELRNELIQKGYQRQTEFSWENSAHKLTKIIENIYTNSEF
ncbi:MAG TPA: glycosyltransferase family 1 protein [Cyanobacteria bacterium UBA9971]|nr:glycosyltransferase family 1 protein [Cyanobacteria bacterium UBA9971]